ncbi:hypothetical protein [Paucihalobacter sp.]|uniref:hypothetical protein n=1 Tax=Paucihalobacter sp. TaxID=2850405 RepID=UPI002FE39F34
MRHTLFYSLFKVLTFLTLIYGCNDDSKVKRTSIDFISSDFTHIIRFNHFETFKSQLNAQSLVLDLKKSSATANLRNLLQPLEAVEKNGEGIIALETESILNYLFVTDTINLTINFEGFDNDSIITSAKKEFRFYKLNEVAAYSYTQGKHFLMSNSLDCLIKAISKREDNLSLLEDFKVIDNTKDVSVINYNKRFLTPVFNQNPTDSITDVFADFSTLDFSFEPKNIRFSGVTASTDSIAILQLFKNTKALKNKAVQIFTADFDNFKSLTISDYTNFEAKLSQIDLDSLPNFITLAVEVAQIETKNNTAVALRFLDDNLISDEILNNDKLETYRDVDIYSVQNNTVFRKSFQPFIFSEEVNYVFTLNDFYVFTKTQEFAQQLIADYTNNNTIAASAKFEAITVYLSDESSLLILKNNQTLSSLLQDLLNTSENITLSDAHLTAFQLIYEDNFAHLNGVISNNNFKRSSKNVSELFSLSLDTDILMKPQFVINHLNREKDIAAQDINNTLYLISNKGAIYWKKRLDGPIIGIISQIDTYKNGRLQLAFVTRNKLYVLDRNGNDVSGFPMNFKDAITQPLSVFDYDNNKNYRLLITQNNELLMLDKNGKTVSGFKPDLSNATISKQPQHFRIGNKDYIVFAQGNKMKILDRVGKTRIDVKESINFSENDIFLNNNQFTTMSAEGFIVQINNRGIAALTGTQSTQNTAMDASSKNVVTFSENKLIINKKEVELDFGNYTQPKLFYLNDKIYVAITDLQTNKAYLFDCQGDLINNFPVYGNATLQLDNVDKNKVLGALTTGSSNSIILYQIQ